MRRLVSYTLARIALVTTVVAAQKVLTTIPVGKRPRGIRVSPDGSTLYVALSGSPIAGPGVDESKLPPPDKRADGIGVVSVADHTLVRIVKAGSDRSCAPRPP